MLLPERHGFAKEFVHVFGHRILSAVLGVLVGKALEIGSGNSGSGSGSGGGIAIAIDAGGSDGPSRGGRCHGLPLLIHHS